MKKTKKVKVPKVGDKIYIPTSMSISHGSDDIAGGLATVTKVYKYMSGGNPNCVFVGVKEVNKSYNWTQFIGKEQATLKKQFGKHVAHPDPDIDTPWLEEGDYYSQYDASTGKTVSGIYKGPSQW